MAYERPQKSTATNWVRSEGPRRGKEWPVEVSYSSALPETPGESAIHLRLARVKPGEDSLGNPREGERITVVLSLEDAIKIHRAVENLYLRPLHCPKKRKGEDRSCPGTYNSPLVGNCPECSASEAAYEARWIEFKAWEASRLQAQLEAWRASKAPGQKESREGPKSP